MVKRWIIRAIVAGLLLLCVGGWGWSVTHYTGIMYYRSGVHAEVGTQWGVVVAVWQRRPVGDDSRIEYLQQKMPESHFWPENLSPQSHFGFRFEQISLSDWTQWSATVPYWFLILIFSIALFFVWRKTAERKMGGGFPIEKNERASGG